MANDPAPCPTINELWGWRPPPTVPPIEELRQVHTRRWQQQLLVCHDFKGDFPDCDRWDGCDPRECAPFLITHWLHIDAFCYYGSETTLVSIPPPAYTSLAHRHGVAVMGTLRFKGDEGYAYLNRIIRSDQNVRYGANQLLAIMETWKFDGWLVIVDVDSGDRYEVERLKAFLWLLSRRSPTGDPHPTSRVIWHDSFLTDGFTGTRNRLCPENSPFYQACDGFFIDVAWTDNDLTASRTEHHRVNPGEPAIHGAPAVFAGIDVWDRGLRNTGWRTNVPMGQVLRAKLSVALFAPGWAVEAPENARDDPQENSMTFWQRLSSVVNTRAIDCFPFKTRFRNGYSDEGKHFCLRDMDLMPALALSNDALIPTEEGLRITRTGKCVLWKVKGMRSNRDLRVKIKVAKGTVKIFLDRREMQHFGIDMDGFMELRPENGECLPIRVIYLEASAPGTYLTYFEAYTVETSRCLD